MAFDANDLSPHEHFVVERTNAGEIADFSAMGGPGGAKPIVRAGFLRKLLLRLDPSWAIRAPGVSIRSAQIEGVLDLTDCSGIEGAPLPPIVLIECEIPALVDLTHARLSRVSFAYSGMTELRAFEARFNGALDMRSVTPLGPAGNEVLTANLSCARIDGDFIATGAKFACATQGERHALTMDNARVSGSMMLSDGFEAFGGVWLRAVRIGDTLDCSGSRFLNRTADGNGSALVAENAEIAGDVFMRRGFLAEGEVWLEGASVSGNIDIDGVIRNEAGEALMLRDINIGGNLICNSDTGCKIIGAVTLKGARVGRNLSLEGVEISHPLTPGGRTYGCALDATSASVGGAMLLHGANIKGELLIADARINGYLALGGGRFINGSDWAVRAPNVRVGGNLTLKLADDGFAPHGQKTVIEGGVKFDRARVDGALSWSQLELRGPGPDGIKGAVFSFADAQIAGPVQAKGMTTQQDAFIDASGATCAALDDDVKTGWGAESARLCLDGFAYGRIDSDGEKWRSRLNWLKRSRRDGERFSPQPFTQAASTYARMGRREDARRVLLAQHDLHTLAGSAGPFSWALSSLFGVIAGYGLAPMRVVRALALFLALGVFGVLAMNAQGALVTPQGRACNGAVEPTLYALDVALPVIDLGQETRCAPGRTARAELSPGVAVSETSDWRWLEGVALWRWAHALYALVGAILTALAIVTFSGIMKPKDQ